MMTKTPSVFSRKFLGAEERFSAIGSGSVGGKALGLEAFQNILEHHAGRFSEVETSIPRLAVIGTDHFAAFMDRNRLRDLAASAEPDERITREFLKADL